MQIVRMIVSFVIALVLVVGVALYFHDLIDQEDDAIYVVPFTPVE
ncbi:MAG: hypothetical protein ACWA5K_02615 [bacterium]